MAKGLTEAEIMDAYRAAEKMRLTDFAKALLVSRQRAHWWLSGRYKPSYEWLLTVVDRFQGWPAEMAHDILQARLERLQKE